MEKQKRFLTTTVKVNSKITRRLPVMTSGNIPLNKLKEVTSYLSKVEVRVPVKLKEVIVSDVLGLGVDILSTRTLKE